MLAVADRGHARVPAQPEVEPDAVAHAGHRLLRPVEDDGRGEVLGAHERILATRPLVQEEAPVARLRQAAPLLVDQLRRDPRRRPVHLRDAPQIIRQRVLAHLRAPMRGIARRAGDDEPAARLRHRRRDRLPHPPRPPRLRPLRELVHDGEVGPQPPRARRVRRERLERRTAAADNDPRRLHIDEPPELRRTRRRTPRAHPRAAPPDPGPPRTRRSASPPAPAEAESRAPRRRDPTSSSSRGSGRASDSAPRCPRRGSPRRRRAAGPSPRRPTADCPRAGATRGARAHDRRRQPSPPASRSARRRMISRPSASITASVSNGSTSARWRRCSRSAFNERVAELSATK